MGQGEWGYGCDWAHQRRPSTRPFHRHPYPHPHPHLVGSPRLLPGPHEHVGNRQHGRNGAHFVGAVELGCRHEHLRQLRIQGELSHDGAHLGRRVGVWASGGGVSGGGSGGERGSKQARLQ